MSEWRATTLGEVLNFQRGFDITKAAQRDGAIPVVSSGGIGSYHDKAAATGPGVVIGRKGTLGKAFYLPGDYWPHDTTLWVQDFKGSHPLFVYYFMTQFDTSWLDAGSANPTLNRNHLHPLKINWPTVQVQRAIADVLVAFDDKIAANTRLISSTSEVLEATFTLICRQPEETVRFSELVTITKGVSYRSADLRESSTALVTLKSFDRNGGYSHRGLKAYAGSFKAVQQIAPGELVVAQTDLTQAAEVVGRAVRVPGASRYEKLIASLDLVIVRPKTDAPVEFLLGVMLQERFRTHCRSRTSGTTVLHLASDAIPTFVAPLVQREVQEAYAAAARPMLELRDSLENEMESLVSARDALLPMLMTGKLRVSDAERVMEEVGA